MKIILTNHSKQRRTYLDITPDDKIIPWVKYFEDRFYLKDKTDNIYKIYFKQYALILKKKRNNLIVISFRYINKINIDELNQFNFKIRNEDKKEYIYRYDFKNRVVSCGTKDEEYIFISRKMYFKFDIQNYKKEIPIKEKDEFIYYNEEEKKWFLKDFKRKS